MEASACWPTSTGEATVDFTGVLDSYLRNFNTSAVVLTGDLFTTCYNTKQERVSRITSNCYIIIHLFTLITISKITLTGVYRPQIGEVMEDKG